MQIVVCKNKVLAHGIDGSFIVTDGTVVCNQTGLSFQNATVITTDTPLPSDIDIVDYEYEFGIFTAAPWTATTESIRGQIGNIVSGTTPVARAILSQTALSANSASVCTTSMYAENAVKRSTGYGQLREVATGALTYSYGDEQNSALPRRQVLWSGTETVGMGWTPVIISLGGEILNGEKYEVEYQFRFNGSHYFGRKTQQFVSQWEEVGTVPTTCLSDTVIYRGGGTRELFTLSAELFQTNESGNSNEFVLWGPLYWGQAGGQVTGVNITVYKITKIIE